MNQTAPLLDPTAYHAVDRSITVDFEDRRLVKITRLRLLSDPGFPMWDLSYCHGELADGTEVHVRLPRHQFPKRNLTGALIEMAKEAGRYGKGMGLLTAVSTLS